MTTTCIKCGQQHDSETVCLRCHIAANPMLRKQLNEAGQAELARLEALPVLHEITLPPDTHPGWRKLEAAIEGHPDPSPPATDDDEDDDPQPQPSKYDDPDTRAALLENEWDAQREQRMIERNAEARARQRNTDEDRERFDFIDQ